MDALNSIDFDDDRVSQVVVVDDNSDVSLSSLGLSCISEKIVVVDNSYGVGIASALNCGLDQINSDYVIRLDADDSDLPGRINIIYNAIMRYPDVDLFAFGIRLTAGNVDYVMSWKSNDNLKDYILFGNPIFHPSVCIKASTLRNFRYVDFFDEYHGSVKGVEDYYLWIRMFRAGAKFRNVSKCTVHYRVWSGQSSANLPGKIDPALILIRSYFGDNATVSVLFVNVVSFILRYWVSRSRKCRRAEISFWSTAIKRMYARSSVPNKIMLAVLLIFLKLSVL